MTLHLSPPAAERLETRRDRALGAPLQTIAALLASGDARALGGLLVLWVAAILLVSPGGTDAHIDDWAFRFSASELADHGRFVLHDWVAPNLLSHLAWGALFTQFIADRSLAFTASTLVLGYGGGAAIYLWLRAARVTPAAAFLGAACLLANPIYLVLSFTFMTDVPATAVQVMALLLLGVGATSPRPWLSGIGWALTLVSLGYRQTAIAIPIGMAAARWRRLPPSGRLVLAAILPIVAFIALQALYQVILAETGRTPVQHNFNAADIRTLAASSWPALLEHVALGLAYAFFYLGLFALPVVVIAYPAMVRGLAPRTAMAVHAGVAVLALAAMGLLLLVFGDTMPFWYHVLGRWGLGGDHADQGQPHAVALALSLASAAGGAMGLAVLVHRLVQLWTADRRDAVAFNVTLALTVGVVLYAPILVMPARYDRYILPVLPCLILALLAQPGAAAVRPKAGRIWHGLAAVLVIASAAWSLAGTRDFLAISRMRQEGLTLAMGLGEPRERINAGWVLNGRDLHGQVGSKAGAISPRSWVGDPVIVVDVVPYHGYETVARLPVQRIIPWRGAGDGSVLVQRRMAGLGAFIGPPSYDQLSHPEFGRARERD